MRGLVEIKTRQRKRLRLRQYRNVFDSISRRSHQVIHGITDLAHKNRNTIRRNSYDVAISVVTLKDLYYKSRKYSYANKTIRMSRW